MVRARAENVNGEGRLLALGQTTKLQLREAEAIV